MLGRRAEDLPAELPRVLREAAFRLGRRRVADEDRARGPVRRRSAPTCCSARAARCRSPSMSRSARTSGRRCRRRPWRRSPARRCCSTFRPATSPSARPRRAGCCARSQSARGSRGLCLFGRGAGRIDHRPRLGRPCRDLTRCGDQLAETERFPQDSTMVTADVDLGRIRQERMRNGTLRRHAPAGRRPRRATSAPSSFALDAPARERGAGAAAIERFPYVPSDPAQAARRIATRPTTSRSRAWRSACRRPAPRTRSSASRAASIPPRR